MNDRLVCIAKFFDSATAHIARSVLDSEGIDACLDAETSNTMLSYIGPALGGVRLLVHEDQAEKAKALLAAHGEADLQDQEVDELDDEQDEEEYEDEEEEDEDEAPVAEDSPELAARNAQIGRAWSAAVIGLLLLPPLLNLYSFYLLFRHDLLADDPRWPDNWRINAALGVNLLAIALAAIILVVVM